MHFQWLQKVTPVSKPDATRRAKRYVMTRNLAPRRTATSLRHRLPDLATSHLQTERRGDHTSF